MSCIYTKIEDDILGELKKLTAKGLQVELMPELEAKVKEATTKTRLTVFCPSSEFEKTRDVAMIMQDEAIAIHVTIESKNIRKRDGIYSVLELVRLTLLGLKTSATDPLTLKSAKFVKFEDNWWKWVAIFEAKSLAVENRAGDIGTLVTSITYEDDNE